MKKVLLLFMLGVFFVFGCREVRIDDSATYQAISYSAGKAMAIGINRLVPQVDADLSAAWTDLMQSGAGQENIEPPQLLIFYNDMIQIISRHTDDPYGLIGDLGVFLMIFGAQYSGEGNLISIESVPMDVMKMFERGYISGRMVVIRSGT